MYFVRKTLTPGKGYSSVFRNHKATSHCNRLHGHDLIFEIVLKAEVLDSCGWVYDFGGFKEIDNLLKNTFDHNVIVASDDPHIDEIGALAQLSVIDMVVLPQVGCEFFATWLRDHVEILLADQGEGHRVLVHEIVCRETDASEAGWRAS
jgi:6-pyruvoyltetrahydropterin/6-carboxytetrahydropterin synthase